MNLTPFFETVGRRPGRLGQDSQQVLHHLAQTVAAAQEPRTRQRSEWTLLLKEYPALIRRPVVVLDDGAVSVGFSDNGFKKLFLR